MNWRALASCKHSPDRSIFFPVQGELPNDETKARISAAKEVCSGCPVRLQCREAGVDEPFGIWGGLTEQERNRWGRRRRLKRPREVVYTQRWLSV